MTATTTAAPRRKLATTAEKLAVAEKVKDRILGNDTIGGMTDKMFDLREKKRQLNDEIAKIEATYAELEERLFEKLDAEGATKCTGKKATASITSAVVANVTDWDALNAYVKKTGYFHLFQRRVSDPAFRELWEAGKKIPGAESYSKRKLNLRTV